MSSHFFLTGEPLTHERLAWIAEILKYYYARIHPESLHHRPTGPVPYFTFFITGDACYSLIDKRCLHLWDILFSFSQFRCICDLREIQLRGISTAPLKMKFPDQFIAVEKTDGNPVDPFWDRFIRTVQGSPDGPNPSAAFFHLQSPYMHRSAVSTVSFLRTAVERGYSPELYAYLDGVHLGHSRQSPAEFENVGEALTEISRRSAEKKQHHLYLCCSRCAVARGYGALDDEKGNYFSFCTIPPFMIRNLDQIVARFKDHHVIASHSAFSICDREFRTASPEIKRRVKRNTPSLNIVITHDPYGTEMTFGALSFAIACAFRDIRTRVIFIEDGIQCLTGTHSTCDDEVTLNIQDIIQAATETQNLELYTYIPSFQLRGVTKNNSFTGVLPIGSQDLARLILVPPKGSASRHRVILF